MPHKKGDRNELETLLSSAWQVQQKRRKWAEEHCADKDAEGDSVTPQARRHLRNATGWLWRKVSTWGSVAWIVGTIGIPVAIVLAQEGMYGIGYGLVIAGGLLPLVKLAYDARAERKAIKEVVAITSIAALLVVGLCIGGLALVGLIHSRQLAKDQEDTFNHLVFKASFPSPDNLRSSLVTTTNGGSTAIQYRMICHVTMLVANQGRSVIQDSFFANHERSGILESGQDAQTDDCLSDISASTKSLECADIKVRLFYSLATQPDRQNEKDHGFILMNRGGHFEWQERAAEEKTSDCNRFVRIPIFNPDEQEEKAARAVQEQNTKILDSYELSVAKKSIARLSNEIFQFGISEASGMPKEPDFEEYGMEGILKYQKQFKSWAVSESVKFHNKFDSGIGQAFESARESRISVVQTDCSIISAGFPPTVSQTRRCGEDVGYIARMLP